MNLQYYSNSLHRPCSMQQCIFDVFNIPWILQELLFSQTSFGGKVSLIFPIIYQIAHLHNWPSCPLIFANRCLDARISSFNWFGGKNEQLSQFAHRFHTDQTCFGIFDIFDIEITQIYITVSDLIMPKPVSLMTVHEAHKEYNSLIDQIQAKYELLDSGECGSVGTPAFNAECSELAHLMARISNCVSIWTCQCPRNFTGPHTSSIDVV